LGSELASQSPERADKDVMNAPNVKYSSGLLIMADGGCEDKKITYGGRQGSVVWLKFCASRIPDASHDFLGLHTSNVKVDSLQVYNLVLSRFQISMLT
jgi:hypothetical protein